MQRIRVVGVRLRDEDEVGRKMDFIPRWCETRERIGAGRLLEVDITAGFF